MEKFKCNVCGFESEYEESFHIHVFKYHRPANLAKMIGNDDVYVCWPCYLKALGVKPKKVDYSLGEHILAVNTSNEPKTVSEILAGINPCDTLTRQHLTEIENEKVANQRQELKENGDIKKYAPPLIPGCPADKKRKEIE